MLALATKIVTSCCSTEVLEMLKLLFGEALWRTKQSTIIGEFRDVKEAMEMSLENRRSTHGA